MSDSAPDAPAGIRPEVWRAYLEAPEHMMAEILGGELHLQPRPRVRHANVAGRLRRRLGTFDDPDVGDPGGWIILFEPELHLGPLDRPVVPDLCGWRRERLPEDFLDPAAITLSPDWVCEVLSERTRGTDRVKKQRIYHRVGVGHVWHVDPDARTFEVFRREAEGWTLIVEAEGVEHVRAPPFDALEIDLARLWTM